MAGLDSSYGCIVVYLVSYFRMSRGFKWVDYDTFFPIPASINIISATMHPLANFLIDNCAGGHARQVALTGAVAGTSLLYVLTQPFITPVTFLMVFPVVVGTLKGFFKQSSLRAGWSHLEKRRGLVSGIVLSGYGLGGSIFGMLFQWLADPLDVEPIFDKKDNEYYLP